MSDYFEERRKTERKSVQMEAVYELKGIQAACEILDISSTGLKMRVKGLLYENDQVNIKLDRQTFPSVVINTSGNIVAVKFEKLTDAQLNYFLKLKEF